MGNVALLHASSWGHDLWQQHGTSTQLGCNMAPAPSDCSRNSKVWGSATGGARVSVRFQLWGWQCWQQQSALSPKS